MMRSDKGAGWVWAQFALMAVILALGAVPPRWPGWVQLVGVALVLGGAAFAVAAGRALGSSLTPYPRPRPDGRLVEDGPFRLVRHPIYAGGLAFFLGYGLLTSIAATAGALALGVLWWFKAGVEERLLAERFPAYGDYRRRVRHRLLPYVL
jgi:protein-S-isoprenylcysteine O-methyltransferase Ste14